MPPNPNHTAPNHTAERDAAGHRAADIGSPAVMRQAYSRTQKLWHWLMAVALTAATASGLYMVSMAFSPAKLQLINYHKWLGVCILVMAAVRLGNCCIRKPQPLPRQTVQNMPPWQIVAHKANIATMYLLFFAIPLTGWLMSSAKGFPVVLFGVLQLPDLIPVNRKLGAILNSAHEILAYTLIALVTIHLLAVAKHQLLAKDGLLWRML